MTVDKFTSNNEYCLEEDGNEWCWTDEMLEDVDMDKIEIIVDGNKVIAKRGDKVGIAKCSPEDEFDIFTGARLAIDRLEKECNPYCWLKKDVEYYVPAITDEILYVKCTFANDSVDKRFMSRGIAFKTAEKAINCAKKMLEVVK